MRKKLSIFALGLLPVACLVLMGQSFGPTTRTPRLTVDPGPTIVEDLTINGTCTGCPSTPVGGADTQVLYNDGGAIGGDAGMVFNETSNTVTLTGGYVLGTRNLYPMIYCNAACDITGMAVGQQAIIKKPSTENKASTTTATLDTDLTFTGYSAGNAFTIQGYLTFTEGGGGYRWKINSANSTWRTMAGHCSVANVPAMVDSTGGGAGTDITCATGNGTRVSFNGYHSIVSGSTGLGVRWAQNTSNAANTGLTADSWIMITRIF